MDLAQRARTVPMPTGTVTFLFTDIEGSTKLLQRLGDDFSELLAVHHRILRAAVNTHNGYEVDTAGDGFFVVFAEPTQAVRAALAAQLELADTSWPQGEQVRVRMGIHTGEVQVSGDNYAGMSIHQAARIEPAREALGADFDVAWSEGHELTDEQILEAAAAVVRRAGSLPG